MADFRDQHIKRALDEAVPRYHPEATPRQRLRRVLAIAAIAAASFAAFWTVLHYSSPRHAAKAPAARPVAIELLPAPARP